MKSYCFVYCSDILHVEKQNADAVYVRGMCLYYQDNVEQAFCHFQHVLRLAPDHQKAVDIYKVFFNILVHA
jgi:DnaJ family protein C protein 7